MARLVTTGFELQGAGAVDGFGTPTGGVTYDSTVKRSGAVSAKFTGNVSGNPSNTFTAPAAGSDVFLRSYIQVPSGKLPAQDTDIMTLGNQFTIVLTTTGTLQVWYFASGTTWTKVGSDSLAITLDAWNRVELRGRIGVGSIDQAEGRLEGASFASGSSLSASDTLIGNWGLGTNMALATAGNLPGAAAILYHDDMAINDSTGGNQNSWPGDGKVVLLSPISDSAVGTGWTLGTGTAISGGSGSTAVKNKPPVGVADLTAGSDAKQIRNATSNANVNYDANLTTYTTAGIGASDTVNVLVPFVATGAPVVTSAKAGTFGISANPAIANVSLGAGGTAGAFWSGVAAGTYPTGWKWSFGTTTYAPTVTLGSSPVARITQVTASTRIADVCAMGMYVDYTPVVPATKAPPFQARTARNTLLRR